MLHSSVAFYHNRGAVFGLSIALPAGERMDLGNGTDTDTTSRVVGLTPFFFLYAPSVTYMLYVQCLLSLLSSSARCLRFCFCLIVPS